MSIRKFHLQWFAEDDGGASAEVATPPEVSIEVGGVTDTPDDGGNAADAGQQNEQKTSKQTPEEDAAFARMRREAEQAKREAAEHRRQLAERDAWVAQKFGPTHGITTWQQYMAAVENTHRQSQAQYMQARESELAARGYDVNEIREIMRLDPEFQNLRQQNQMLQQTLTMQQHKQRVADIEKQFKSDLATLRKEYGDIVPKSVEELDESTVGRIQKGYSLADAWVAANKDLITSKVSAKAKADTARNIGGKAHLATEKSGAGDMADMVEISPEKLRVYRSMFPNEKLSDYKRREAKYLKGRK